MSGGSKAVLAAVVASVVVAAAGGLAWVYLVPPPAAMPHGGSLGITADQAARDEQPPPEQDGPAPIRFSSGGSLHNAEMQYAFFTPDSFLWEFGDGATSAERDPTHRYDQTGDYTVTLTITSTDGTEYQERRTITVR